MSPDMSIDDSQLVLVEVDERVATMTLNRPDQRNALSRALQRRIEEVVTELEADDGGNAGLVLPKESSRGPLPPHTKPVIGAINGVAVTGGFELALACDFLIASDRARFADTHARVGVMPGWGLTVLLAEAVGVRRAR